MGDHRQFELESRFTAGVIQIPGTIPAAARFFGGNHEQSFITGDAWQIRANPVIRSIPANRFYRTAEGAGASSFAGMNLTAAFTVWRQPIVPAELLSDPHFQSNLNFGIESAEGVLKIDYMVKDRHYTAMAARLPDVQQSLPSYQSVVGAAEQAHPGQFVAEFKKCKSALVTAVRRASAAAAAKADKQYGDLIALLPADETEDRLSRVATACVTGLNQDLKDPAMAAEDQKLLALRDAMQSEFEKIDQAKADAKAKAEIKPAQLVLNTILKEMNLASVSPVGIFDVARIGPANSTYGGLRYGAGGGVRFTLVSSVSVTAGYAWNPTHKPGEGQGAFFFAMKFHDLFE